MLLSHSFVIDLRSEDFNIIASSLSESITEYSSFLAGASKKHEFSLSWKIYVISPSHELFRIYSYKDDYSFVDLIKSMKSLKEMNFDEPLFTKCTEEGKDPLETAISLSTIDFASGQCNFNIFMSSKRDITEIDEELLKNVLKNRKTAYPNASDLCFVVIGEQTSTCEQLSTISQTITFENEEDCYFMFFRSLVIDIIFPPSFDILEIKDDMKIEVQTIKLFSPVNKIENKSICKCHRIQTIKTSSASFYDKNKQQDSYYCFVSKKKISKQNIMSASFIGNFQFPADSIKNGNSESTEVDFDIQDVYKVIGRINIKDVSESFVYGCDIVMASNSPMFFRLINEMRSCGESLITKKLKKNVIYGEYYVIVPDMCHPILHIKNIANRSQIIRFPESLILPDESEEIYNEPILQNIEQLENINPFVLGKTFLL